MHSVIGPSRTVRRVLRAALVVAVIGGSSAFSLGACGCGNTASAATDSTNSKDCPADSGGGLPPCSPYAERSNSFGKISVQQAGAQRPVAWGVYPTDPVGSYSVVITVGDQVYDKKTQAYPPHGSVKYDAANKRLLPSGASFNIDGTISRSGEEKEVFYFSCTLA